MRLARSPASDSIGRPSAGNQRQEAEASAAAYELSIPVRSTAPLNHEHSCANLGAMDGRLVARTWSGRRNLRIE